MTAMTTATAPGKNKTFNAQLFFQLFKYAVYCLLSMNIYYFFVDDYSASLQTFAGGIALSQLIEAFTATIDTAAWVVLLLLFELETYVLDDEKIKGAVKWSIHLTRAVCYLFIIFSFYGFTQKYSLLHNLIPYSIPDACSLIGSKFTHVVSIDEYIAITAESCKILNTHSSDLVQITGTNIISHPDNLLATQRLSLVETTNSATWLMIVAILEVDVFLQARDKLAGTLMWVSKAFKAVLYSVLFLCAVYWGVKGSFLDFWDAFLWLVAFVFIEMNIFEWHEENQEAKALAEESHHADPV
tara:strand:- start:23067 stop:23963 length:897 start_codon:yes stop_codon:yes gene_type:complete